MDIVERILEQFQIPEPARAVYMDLVEHGGAPARLIATRLSMTRPSVYDQLKILIRHGLVVEKERDGKTEFLIHDIADLERKMIEKEKHLAQLRQAFAATKHHLFQKTRSAEPKIKFISDREGIVQSMHDMLWDESLCLKVVWPYQEMLKVLGKEALVDFNQKRIRNGIRLQTIWTEGKKHVTSHIWQTDDWGVERRFGPAGFDPRMGYTIYGDKVLFVSSARETFAFTVQSKDFADLMSLQFDTVWNISKKDTRKK